jgi:WhiB family redox-sensing transcriptional regulator
MWFTEATDEKRHQAAIDICGTCPVRNACLDYALSVPNMPGTWGGTTQTERTRLRKQSRRHNAA